MCIERCTTDDKVHKSLGVITHWDVKGLDMGVWGCFLFVFFSSPKCSFYKGKQNAAQKDAESERRDWEGCWPSYRPHVPLIKETSAKNSLFLFAPSSWQTSLRTIIQVWTVWGSTNSSVYGQNPFSSLLFLEANFSVSATFLSLSPVTSNAGVSKTNWKTSFYPWQAVVALAFVHSVPLWSVSN